MAIERVKFPGALGHDLSGIVEMPEGRPRAWALFAHCFSCSKDLKAAYWINKALVDEGLAILRFDFTGLGESGGEFADTNFSSNLEDLRAAIRFLADQHQAPQILVGHSLGGAAVLKVAGEFDAVKAVATIAAPSDTKHLSATLERAVPEAREEGEGEMVLGGQRLRITKQLLEDLDQDHLDGAMQTMNKALLVLHSPEDKTVDVRHARHIFAAAAHPKSYVSLSGADHLLSRERDARYAGELIASWASRYLELPPLEDGEEAGAEGEVIVTGPGVGFATRIKAGRHTLQADEPPDVGGSDTGPTPYGYLLSALGACMNMTARMYAQRKGWPLEEVEVRLKHSKVHAKDCETCVDTDRGQVDRIEKQVIVKGDLLSEEQKQRIVEITEKCPVHRTLKGEIDIVSV